MKKIFAVLLMLSIMLTVSACGKQGEVSTAQTTAVVEAASAPAEKNDTQNPEMAAVPQDAKEETAAPDPTATYDKIIADYSKAIEEKLPGTTLAHANMNTDILLLYAEKEPLSKIGYFRYDIEGDGIDELFIGPVYDEDSHNKGLIYHLFTYDAENDTYKDLFVSNQNDKLFLCNDYSFVRAFAPADGITEYCMLDKNFDTTGIIQGQGQSVPEYDFENKQFVIKDVTAWSRIEGDGGEGSVIKNLTDDEVIDAIEALYESYMEIPYISFAEYKG